MSFLLIVHLFMCSFRLYNFRPRLKGCESEISELLSQRWRHVTYDWKEVVVEESNLSDLRRSNLRTSFANQDMQMNS